MPTNSLVMLIDDSALDRHLNSLLLKKHSDAIRIIEMESAILAIDYLFELEEDSEDIPDLIFLDINMPLMDGFEFLDEFDKLPAWISSKCLIYMLSSAVDPRVIFKSINTAKVKSLINKPLSREDIKLILN